MRLLVGYTADDRGAEAIALASALGGEGAHLDLAIVLPRSTPFSASYPGGDHGYRSILAEKIDGWAQTALGLVPAGISARVIARSVESPAQGLILLAQETGARAIVLGGRARHVAGFFVPGSVASSLLHASPVPVAMGNPGAVAALARAGGKLGRVTAFVGTRAGARGVIQAAASAAARQPHLTLRVVSLVAQDELDESKTDLSKAISAAEARVCDVLTEHRIDAEISIASGSSIDDAITELEWNDGDIAFIGSSRLARKKRLFLGTTGQRILRTLPVPLVVVPKSHTMEPAQS